MKIVFFTGAGISAESGIKTFRDNDGLWEGHSVEEVATPEGFERNPELVLGFYNQRRKQLLEVLPNKAHLVIAELQNIKDISSINVITQNVDDLHERAGSKNVCHLHGELLQSKCSVHEHLVYECKQDIVIGNLSESGHQLRPNIVWFGEAVPEMERAIEIASKADILVIVGTSLQVYPAASIIQYCSAKTKKYYIDNNIQNKAYYESIGVTCIEEKASVGLGKFVESLK